MKVGEVIEFEDIFGVIYEIEGDSAYMRYQWDTIHQRTRIDLIEYYSDYNPDKWNYFKYYIKGKLYRTKEFLIDLIWLETESIGLRILWSIMLFLLILTISSLFIVFSGVIRMGG